MSVTAMPLAPPWMGRTGLPCQGEPNDRVWFPTPTDEAAIGQAKALCGRCPIKTACGRYAIVVREPFGVYGGLTPKERAQIGGYRAWQADL